MPKYDWDRAATAETSKGLMVVSSTDDRSRISAEDHAVYEREMKKPASTFESVMAARDQVRIKPVSFGVVGKCYLPNKNQWEEIAPLANKTLAQVVFRDLDDVSSPQIRSFIDSQGNIDFFWKEYTPRSDLKGFPTRGITIHSARYAADTEEWRDGKSIVMEARGLTPKNDMWDWDRPHPPSILREPSGHILFAWADNFQKHFFDTPGAIPDTDPYFLSITKEYYERCPKCPRLASMVLATRYDPADGSWSDLTVLDMASFYATADRTDVELFPLEGYGTLAIWWVYDDNNHKVFKSRLLR
jgi:hypothetical protein